jgi:hypothetical protein
MSRPPDEINILDGKFYLKDAGYACRSEILPPFSYLLYEFSTRDHHLKDIHNVWLAKSDVMAVYGIDAKLACMLQRMWFLILTQ